MWKLCKPPLWEHLLNRMSCDNVNTLTDSGYDCFVSDARDFHPLVHAGWYFHIKVKHYYWWNSDLYICFENNQKTARCICYPRCMKDKADYFQKLQKFLLREAKHPEPRESYMLMYGGWTYYKSRGDAADVITSNLRQLLQMHTEEITF